MTKVIRTLPQKVALSSISLLKIKFSCAQTTDKKSSLNSNELFSSF